MRVVTLHHYTIIVTFTLLICYIDCLPVTLLFTFAFTLHFVLCVTITTFYYGLFIRTFGFCRLPLILRYVRTRYRYHVRYTLPLPFSYTRFVVGYVYRCSRFTRSRTPRLPRYRFARGYCVWLRTLPVRTHARLRLVAFYPLRLPLFVHVCSHVLRAVGRSAG